MKLVNIEDIEDIILTKYEFDKILNNGKRSDLNSFIHKYCNCNKFSIITFDEKTKKSDIVGFNIEQLDSEYYLFCTSQSDTTDIETLLKKYNYNIDSLKPLSNIQITKIYESESSYKLLIKDGLYYNIC